MFEDRPWLAHYSPGVPADVEVPNVTVPALLAEAARRWPDRVAVDFFGATTTYRELAAETAAAAEALAALGVGPGDRVALVLPNCRSHVVAFHAVASLGAIVVEHNPTYTAQELHDQFVLTGSTVALVWRNRVADVQVAAGGTDLRHVVSVDVADDLPAISRLALRLPVRAAREKRTALTGGDLGDASNWKALLRGRSSTFAPRARPDDTALLLFTGGTTGVPKGAELSHANLVANATQGQAWASFREGDEVVYGMLPFFHAFGMMFCLVLPPLIGATLVAFPNFDPVSVVAAQRRRPATFVPGVAPMFGRLIDAAEASSKQVDLSTIRLAFSGAMPLGRAVAERWESATGGLLIEGYGMSECSPIVLGNPCSADRKRGALGLPFPSTLIRVMDQDDPSVEATRDASGTLRGELHVKGPQVFQGYWERPDETALMLGSDGWLRTGDVVEVDEQGFAVLVDRVKEMIVVGGFKVFPSVVEDLLREMPSVRDVAVVGLPRGDDGDEEVLAVVVPHEQHGPPTLEALREFAAHRLPHYALPRKLDLVAELPVSMIGKILRRVVRAEHLERARQDH